MYIEQNDRPMDWIEKHGKVVPRSNRHAGVKYKSPHRDIQDYYFDGMTVKQRVQDEAHEAEISEAWHYHLSGNQTEATGLDVEEDIRFYPDDIAETVEMRTVDQIEALVAVDAWIALTDFDLKTLSRAEIVSEKKVRYFGRQR